MDACQFTRALLSEYAADRTGSAELPSKEVTLHRKAGPPVGQAFSHITSITSFSVRCPLTREHMRYPNPLPRASSRPILVTFAGRTWLPRLDSLAAVLQPYNITRPAYEQLCGRVDDLAAVLQVGKGGEGQRALVSYLCGTPEAAEDVTGQFPNPRERLHASSRLHARQCCYCLQHAILHIHHSLLLGSIRYLPLALTRTSCHAVATTPRCIRELPRLRR